MALDRRALAIPARVGDAPDRPNARDPAREDGDRPTLEPVTQALLGAATSELVAGKNLRGRALGWGALIGMSPDLDVLFRSFHEGYGDWLYHRGTTHSLWFGFVVGPLLGFLLWRWRDRGREDTLPAWIRVAIIALVTHPLLDGFTPYGTQLFAPFDRARFAWNGVAIVDPFYSVMLGTGVAIAAMRRFSSELRRRAVALSLALSTAYLAIGLAINRHVVTELQVDLEPHVGPISRLRAYPTIFQPWLRSFVAHTPEALVVGLHSWQEAGCPAYQVHLRPPDSATLETVRAMWQVEMMHWFSDGDVATFVHTEPEGVRRFRFEDMRYAWASDATRGMWGLEVRVAQDGQILGEPRRLGRVGPAAADFDRFARTLTGRLPAEGGGWKRAGSCSALARR